MTTTVYANEQHHWDWTNEDTDVDKLLRVLGLIDMRLREVARLKAAGDDRLEMIGWYSENERAWVMSRISELDPDVGKLPFGGDSNVDV